MIRGETLFETIGVAGIAISMVAYFPQVVHLAREHCSAGVSRRAWAMWLVSSLLIGALAFHRRDPVFILLQVSSMTSAAIILALAQRYRGLLCQTHAFPVLRPTPTTDGVVHRWPQSAEGATLEARESSRGGT